ncbi:hypothetical protein POM88_047637 [Heracleum sosnowskyi]|uniref:Uncharacterized protein n=1 Tax=Heracleum sosnowskyi TaxID=360622 RepID=A0AAD8GTM8_9APIA|nr:hypothetical protein POM88_047637 [Heracleum sosnowskyi]
MEGEGWFYNCCPRCACKVHATGRTSYCENITKETNDFKPRTNLELQHSLSSIRRQSSSSVFPFKTLSMAYLRTQTSLISPKVIKKFVGKKCAFDIKINAYNTERSYKEFTVYHRLTEFTTATYEKGDKELEEIAKNMQIKA